jgi:hypothetical protein
MSQWNETCSQSPANREKFDPPAPTPLERLEAWVKAVTPGQRLANVLIDGDYSKACCMEQGVMRGRATADDPDAAILAALVQAEGER